LWTFLRIAGVEPTNNAAERGLRRAVRRRRKYTLCASHYNEGMRAHGRNAKNVGRGSKRRCTSYQPTECAKCKRVIKLAVDGYSMKGGKYYCDRCTGFDLSRLLG
jgi:hypothetical protein